jgi:integrase/recombinase XerC
MDKGLIDKYLTYLKETLSYKDATIKTYRYLLEQFVASKKTPEKYLNKFSGSYRNRNINIISSYYSWLVKTGVKTKSNIGDIKRSKENKKVPKFASAVKLDEIIKAIPEEGFLNLRNKALLEFGIAVGARISEFTYVKMTDLDLVNKKVKVYGKGKERIQDLTDAAISILIKYIVERDKISKCDYLFITEQGQQLKYPYYVIKPLIGNLTPHQFNRHSLAIGLIRNGMDLYQVSKVMRHSSISTTAIYLSAEDPTIQEQLKKKHPRS